VNGSSARKPHRLSIVIPAAGDAVPLEETLVSVLENRPPDCEVIAVHGCDYADPWGIGDEVRLLRAPRRTNIVGCINLGIAAASGRVIHVLAAGWRGTDGWTDQPVEAIASGRADVVVPLGVAADDHDRAVSAGIRHTAGGRRVSLTRASAGDSGRPTCPELEAGFWSAEMLAAIGAGFATACGPDLADADAAAAVACAGGTVMLEPSSRVIVGPPRRRARAFRAGLHAERLFWRSLPGTSPVRGLVLHAGEWLRDLAGSAPLGTLPMLLSSSARACGGPRCSGRCVPRRPRSAPRRLRTGSERSASTGRIRGWLSQSGRSLCHRSADPRERTDRARVPAMEAVRAVDRVV